MSAPHRVQHQPRARFARWAGIGVLILAASFAGYARPAQAQFGIPQVTFDIPQIISNIWDKIQSAATWALEHGAAIAFRNAAKTFTQQIAYNAAVQLTSGGQGQQPLFQVKPFGQVISDAADSAAGDFVDRLATSFVGFNVCNPSGLNAPGAKLIIGTALFTEVKPQQPLGGSACTLSQISANWQQALNDPLQRTKLLSNFGAYLDPRQNDLGIALSLQTNLINTKNTASQSAAGSAQQNQGYLPLAEEITGFIKTPAPELKSTREFTTQQIFAEPLVFTGDIVADALGVFTNTFAARFMKRLQQGIIPQPSKLASSRFGNQFGAPAGGIEYAIEVNSSISTPEIKQEDIDVISDFSDCPQNPSLAPPNNCTIGTGFVQALRSAQSGNALTVQEAIDKGFLAGNWVFKPIRSAGLRTPDAWYLSDLKKLRKARIIPVGWELSAGLVNGTDKTLQQVMGSKSLNYSDGFNGTGPDSTCGTADDTALLDNNSSFDPVKNPSLCGLVDPDWVLKAPPAQCRMLAYGQQLEFQGGQRQQVCVDTQNCVAENADGSCQAWGYCTKEKNIWRFSGQSCEFPEGSGYSPYATCQSFTNAGGQTVSYLKNSLTNFDDGVCSGAAGCQWYSVGFNGATTAGTGRYDDADASRIYLKNVQNYSCDVSSEGCHTFLRLSQINTSAIPVGTPGVNPAEQVTNYVSTAPAASYSQFAKTQTTHLREAPANLKCYDANPANDDPSCKNYLQLCSVQEAGCELYQPSDGSPAVPAVASVTDTCPTECAGFNTYQQLPSFFEPAPKLSCVGGTNDGNACTVDADCGGVPAGTCTSPNVNFIPKTAQQCSAADVGCEEFTNVEAGERKEYYSQLRQCVKPEEVDGSGNNLTHTYYTWVGSDLTGYQLKTWQLEALDPALPSSAPLTTDPLATDCRVGGVFPTSNPDCKQFYDATGGQHYVLASLTVTSSATCQRYRATNVSQADCSPPATWQPSGGGMACFYRAIPNEGKSCSASAASCREYRGPTANNVKLVFPISTFGDSEPGVNADTTPLSGWGMTTPAWTQGTSSTESTSAFGHSLDSGVDGSVGKDVSGIIAPGKQYVLTFWAKHREAGANTVFAQLFNATPPTQTLSFGAAQPIIQEWQVFTFGPLEVPTDAAVFNTSGTLILRVGATGGNFYLDNVALREVQDTFFVRKGSWQTPLSCLSPQDLRCAAYTDRAHQRYTLTGFSQLCRVQAVGCEALVDTRNTTSPQATNFSTLSPDNQAALASLDLDKADQVVYRVYDTQKSCAASANACYRLGWPKLTSSGAVSDWADTFVKIDPVAFTQAGGTVSPTSPLCGQAQDRCAEFKDSSGVLHYFRDPGTQACNYKQVDPLHGYDWYKQGTNELCNLVPNSSFEQFQGSADDTAQDTFTNWERNGATAALDQRGELYAVSSLNGQYWGATALKVRSTAVQYSGVWSKPISIPALAGGSRPERLFLFTARFYVPTGASISNSWEFSRHAMRLGACDTTCHHYSLVGGSIYVTSTDPQGTWLTRSYVIKTETGVDTLEAGIITNIGASGWQAGEEIYVDDVRIVELPLPKISDPTNGISDDQALSLANAGFANLCPADQASCTAFRDPALTKQTYYYLNNSKLDTQSCAGQVSEKNGCLLFNDLSQAQAGWNANATYDASRVLNNRGVAPVSSVPNDTNTVLKVRRDRVCDEWLSCQSESVRFSGNKAQSICYSLGRCDQWGASGIGKCGDWLDPEANPQPLNVATYRARAAGGSDPTRLDWADVDYSGYSIPNVYPIDTLTQKNYSPNSTSPNIRLTYLNTNVFRLRCNGLASESICGGLNTICRLTDGSQGICQYLDMGVSGNGPGDAGVWQYSDSKICRAYPEPDAPFPESVVNEWQPSCTSTTPGDCSSPIQVAKTKAVGFKDASTCQQDEDCECTYARATYTQGEMLYYGLNSDVLQSFSTEQSTTKLRQRDTLIGLKGYCLERDPSRLVNAGAAQDQACLTWLPLDVVSGEISIYDYSPEAGFQSSGQAYYCSKAVGMPSGASGYAVGTHQTPVVPAANGCGSVSWSGAPSGCGVFDGDNMYCGNASYTIAANVCSDVRFPVALDAIERTRLRQDILGIDVNIAGYYGSGLNGGMYGGKVTLNEANGWCASTGDSPPSCTSVLPATLVLGLSHPGSCGSTDWAAIRAIFDSSSRFIGYNAAVCDGSSDSGGAIMTTTLNLAEYCIEASQVATAIENKAWTDRTQRSSGFQAVPNAESELGFTRNRIPVPFGIIPSNILVAGSTNPLVLSDNAGATPVGANYTTISTPFSCGTSGQPGQCGSGNASVKSGMCIAGSKNNASTFGTACDSSKDCSDDPNQPGICEGYLTQVCEGGPTPGKFCAGSNDCGGGTCTNFARTMSGAAAFQGMQRVQQLFAKVYDVYDFSPVTGYTVHTSVPVSTDISGAAIGTLRQTGICSGGSYPGKACSVVADCPGTGATCSARPAGYGVPYPPQVKQVLFDDVTKGLKEGAAGFTVHSVSGDTTSGTLTLRSPAPVTVLFYAYNPNGEQLPLARVMVDWYGDGTHLSGDVDGRYKNHKHVCASPNVCSAGSSSAGRTCKVDADCGIGGSTCVANPLYTFGDSAQACQQDMPNVDGFFNFTNVFMCTRSSVYYNADPTVDACEFTPKVYVSDNWDWCTGYNTVTGTYGRWGFDTSTAISRASNCIVERDTSKTDGGAWISSDQTSPIRILVRPRS